MFKKALQVVTTFGVLLAAYAGYVRIFAIIAAGVGPDASRATPWQRRESTTQQEATKTAARAFGPKHWSGDPALPVRYYNHERGYWMYAKEYERLNGGKQLRLRPFAIVMKSRDGQALKTASSDEAIVDLDQPLGVANKSGTAMKVVHARMEGNVQLRDDKGTPRSTIDDLVIGPMPYVEFDEPSLQIKSVSDIVIQDRDMRITGFDLLIQLRPKDESAPSSTAGGFDAKTAYIRKNVHIVLNDVGRTGILPGKAEAEAGSGPAAVSTQPREPGQGEGQGQEAPTPLDLRCAGEMRVELPKPRKAVEVGPPAPPLPTLIYFARDVIVIRGKPVLPGQVGPKPDQLDCDALRLTMVPKPKALPTPKPASNSSFEPAETAEPAPAATGAGTEMALREALATGHAVWLQSPGQGITARCNELIHKKLAPEQADETYLRGDSKTKLWVEKVETADSGPNKGKVGTVTTIRTIDATIFEDGKGSQNATIVARGPGLLETRPSRDKPVERKAIWQDHLVMRTEFDGSNRPTKKVTLTGKPEFIDVAQASLDAEKEIVVWLTPKPKTAAVLAAEAKSGKPAPAAPGAASDSFQIEKLRALGNVHLISPGKVMNARNELDALFESPAPAKPAAGAAPGTPEKAKAAPTPAPDPAAPPATGEKAEPATTPKAKPAEPGVTVSADRVWALIRTTPNADPTPTGAESSAPGNTRGEIQKVLLRGGVAFHQDPDTGKTQGTDVTGEALDVHNQGDGKMMFVVENLIDSAKATTPEKAMAPHARVATEEMTITGPRIGLDQAADHAWVEGAGTLTQMAPRGLLTDKGLGEGAPDAKDHAVAIAESNTKEKDKDKAKASVEANKRPMRISWKSSMKFVGRPENVFLRGTPVALVQFHDDVRAVMDDAQLACKKRMDVYMDRQVSLVRPKGVSKEAAPGEEPEPRPQISLLDCFENVVVESRKIDPDTRVLLQKQRIEGARVTYDKLTGNFHVPGKGKVALWNREDGADNPLAAPTPAPADPGTTARRSIKPASNPAAPVPLRRTPPVIGHNASQIPPAPATAKGGAAAGRAKLALLPLKATVITFDDEMTGRYVAGKDEDTTETRWATFLGDVQTLHATVANENTLIDFDRPPEDFVVLNSQQLNVSSTPTPGKSSAAKNNLIAVNEAQAKTRNETIKADVITYDSQKGLFYAYAEGGRPVAVLRQDTIGQPASGGLSQAIKYNRLTGESEFIRPMSAVEFVNIKTGIRPGPAGETKDKRPKTPRIGPGMKIPGRSQTERKGMTGR
ncbi:hypothetical protein SAMN05444166_4447 [Singulisphaera sp. GP187]|uniref:hypothetical protein n=1 Tax=Singulisphaera sp. GP187 TaxID=1882752 RepID=UPI000929547E|nr:hypothetical protein [Singulisphaera sp. GP187]SIO40684.1 hypothetical protein SAMN05444166_4447 [Singulisphaera sp. GP187]